MKTPLILILFLQLILTELIAQKYDFEYDSVGAKVAIKDVQSGKLLSGYIYDDVDFRDHLGIIRKGKKYGLFNINNGKIYGCDYDRIDDFDSLHYSGQKGVVKKKGKEGIIGLSNDKGLEIILPLKYKSVETSYHTKYLFVLRKGNKYGVFNIKTRKILPFWVKEPSAIGIQGNYIVINEQEKFGLLSSDGKELLPTKYSSISLICLGSDVFQVYEGEKAWFYDARIEKLLVEPIEENWEAIEIYNRFYTLYYEGVQTFIDDLTGKPVLPLEYNFTGELNKERYMQVKYKGKYGIYDFKELKLIVPCIYTDEDKLIEKEAQYFN
jgi:hypothetical protein